MDKFDSKTVVQTANFFWCTNWLLGSGAKGRVFKGINKQTGEFVAIKVYHKDSQDDFEKETKLIEDLDHENIVKLIAVETEPVSKTKAVVLEYCNGCSLDDVLNHPENANGLNDDQFLQVLHDITAGLKYLRSKSLSHRDLKPANIVKYLKDDGTSIYKIIDFGTAKNLPDGVEFKTLCGTAPYMPAGPLYKAYFGSDVSDKCTSLYDLRLLGATLYHILTGSWPFRPRNQNIHSMLRLLQNLPEYAIEAIELKNGRIRVSKRLPPRCLLSANLRHRLEIILCNLLREKEKDRWSFEKYFDAVKELLSTSVFHVFFGNRGQLISIYSNNIKSLKDLQKMFTEVFQISPSEQLCIFNKEILSDDSETCPKATPDDPIIFLDLSEMNFLEDLLKFGVLPKYFREFEAWMPESMRNNKSMIDIISSCFQPLEIISSGGVLHASICIKTYSSVMFAVKRFIEKIVLLPAWILTALETLKKHFHSKLGEINLKIEKLHHVVPELEERLARLKETVAVVEQLNEQSTKISLTNSWVNINDSTLQNLVQSLSVNVDKITENFQKCCVQQKEVIPWLKIVDNQSIATIDTTKYLTEIDTHVKSMYENWEYFKNRMFQEQLGSEEILLFTLKSKQINTLKQKVLNLTENLLNSCKVAYENFSPGYKSSLKILQQLSVMESTLKIVETEIQNVLLVFSEASKSIANKIQRIQKDSLNENCVHVGSKILADELTSMMRKLQQLMATSDELHAFAEEHDAVLKTLCIKSATTQAEETELPEGDIFPFSCTIS